MVALSLGMWEVAASCPSLARVDSVSLRNIMCKWGEKYSYWCIHPSFKSHGHSQLKSKTEVNSDTTKWVICHCKNTHTHIWCVVLWCNWVLCLCVIYKLSYHIFGTIRTQLWWEHYYWFNMKSGKCFRKWFFLSFFLHVSKICPWLPALILWFLLNF